MNPRAMPRIILSLSLALMLPLGGCDIADPVGPPPLEGAAIGGPFELVGGDGETVRWSDFDGQYRTIYFGFTNCPDICPTDMQRTMQGYHKFAESHPELAAKVQPIFVSVDYGRDTPETVTEFAAAFSDHLLGLTGSKEQLDQATKNFASPYTVDPTGGADGSYEVTHYSYSYLFGPDGEPITTLPTDLGADAVAAELAKWVR